MHLAGLVVMCCKGNGSYFYQVEPHSVSCSSEQISSRWSEPHAHLGQKRSLSPCLLAKNKNLLLSDPSYFFGLKMSAASKAAPASWALGICSEKAQKELQKLSWGSVSSYLSASLTPWEFLPCLVPKCICQRTPWRCAQC